jgi:hypothetical protein
MYVALEDFHDRVLGADYRRGEAYPGNKGAPTEDWLRRLSTPDNRVKRAVIAKGDMDGAMGGAGHPEHPGSDGHPVPQGEPGIQGLEGDGGDAEDENGTDGGDVTDGLDGAEAGPADADGAEKADAPKKRGGKKS